MRIIQWTLIDSSPTFPNCQYFATLSPFLKFIYKFPQLFQHLYNFFLLNLRIYQGTCIFSSLLQSGTVSQSFFFFKLSWRWYIWRFYGSPHPTFWNMKDVFLSYQSPFDIISFVCLLRLSPPLHSFSVLSFVYLESFFLLFHQFLGLFLCYICFFPFPFLNQLFPFPVCTHLFP